jgi:hypothetical protein
MSKGYWPKSSAGGQGKLTYSSTDKLHRAGLPDEMELMSLPANARLAVAKKEGASVSKSERMGWRLVRRV